MRTFSALLVATALGFASLAHAGGGPGPKPPDLTGTWTGKFTCKGISDSGPIFGAFTFTDKAATLEITQNDRGLIARFAAQDPHFPFPFISDMCGGAIVNPVKTKQVRAGLVGIERGLAQPGNAFAVDFKTVKVFEPNGKGVTGTLKGGGVLISGNGFGGTSASCKWSFERTDTASPADPPTSCDASSPV